MGQLLADQPVHRIRRRAVATTSVFVAAWFAVSSVCVASSRHASQVRVVSSCAPSPFDAELAGNVEGRWPGHHVTAAVYDATTRCEYLYHPERRLTTASVFKVQIMAGVLLRAQQAGRDLTQWERDRLYPMMSVSSDPDANALWSDLGGVAGMQAIDRAFGLTETVPSQVWGLTVTSARDRTRLDRQILHQDYGPLSAPYRALARAYMSHAVPSQHWGISAGLPRGWSVVLKNGFFSSSCCAWRIGSTGFVFGPAGAGYAITVMSDGWPTDRPGIAAVEYVSRAVALQLASPPVPPFRSADAALLQQYGDVLGTRPDLATRMAVSPVLADDPRRLPPFITFLLTDPRLAFDRPVARLYLAGLLRPPTPDRFNAWLSALRTHRMDLRAVAVAFAETAEFGHRYGGLAAGPFVDLLYRNVLGRAVDGAARRYWVSRLGSGAVQGDVMLALTSSSEGQRHWRGPVDALVVYRSLLRRIIGAGEIPYWTTVGRAADYQAVRVAAIVFASSEYHRRFAG